MKSNLQIINEVNTLKKENEELKTRLSINSKIIQEFFKNSNINEKMSLFIENIKKENNNLLNEITELKRHNQKLASQIENNSNPNSKNLEEYKNKLFIYENLLKEKQSIIVNIKEQNKNMKSFIESNINKKEMNESVENENNKDLNNINYKYIIEEIYVISPRQIINTLNNKIELYKDINSKLKNIIQEMKSRLLSKDKAYLKLDEEISNLKLELQKQNQIKNNEEIINQLIQYQSMKSISTSKSCSNFNSYNVLKNKNTRNKQTRSLSYINNHTHDLNKVMKEIETYENFNKTVKEISNSDFDLAGEWAETLKMCGMTQEEFVRFCGMKITNKLTNAIEYMYKILIDKNIQIKLLSKENETLNEENIRLNKINIQMENIVDYYEKNYRNNVLDDNKDININKNNYNEYLNRNKKNKIIKSNTFIEEDKNKDKNTLLKNKLQKTYVNVDNNITHTNININMMMDCNNRRDLPNNKKINIINNSAMKNKSSDKLNKYIKLRNKKINNNSYNKLIKEKKNILTCKTLNLSSLKKSKSKKYFEKINNNSFNYNKAIKNLFSNTEKLLLKNKERNTVTIGNNIKRNFNYKINKIFTDLKMSNKYKNKINKSDNE